MTVNRKPTGMTSSVPGGLACGIGISAVITVLGCLITAKLIDGEIIPWNGCGYAVMVILMLSSWTGATVSRRKIRRRILSVSLASGAGYFLMLMAATALFFGGQYSGVGETALVIFCGSMLGFFTGIQRKPKPNPGKRRRRNC